MEKHLENSMPGADDLDDGLDYQVSSGSEDEFAIKEQAENQTEEEPVNDGNNKKRRKKEKLHQKKQLKMEIDSDRKKRIAEEKSLEVICDFINDKIKQKNLNLSALELADLLFNKNDFESTTEMIKEPRNLSNLSGFLVLNFGNVLPIKAGKNTRETSTGKGKKDEKDQGTGKDGEDKKETEGDCNEENRKALSDREFIAIISMSAIRACDVFRATKKIPGSSLKIINKNKLNVDLDLLQNTSSRVLCCTPGRLLKILEHESKPLKKEQIKAVIVDNTYLDSKRQNTWDIKETMPLLRLLSRDNAKIYLY